MRRFHLALAFLVFGIFTASSLATEPVWMTDSGTACQECPAESIADRRCLPEIPVVESSDCLICCSLITREHDQQTALTGKYLIDICVCETGYQPAPFIAGFRPRTHILHERTEVPEIHPRRGPPTFFSA